MVPDQFDGSIDSSADRYKSARASKFLIDIHLDRLTVHYGGQINVIIMKNSNNRGASN